MDLISFAINLFIKDQSLYKSCSVNIDSPNIGLGVISLARKNQDSSSDPFITLRVFEKISEDDVIDLYFT